MEVTLTVSFTRDKIYQTPPPSIQLAFLGIRTYQEKHLRIIKSAQNASK